MIESRPSIWVIGVGYLGSRLLAAFRAQGRGALGVDREADCDCRGDAADGAFLSSLVSRYALPTQVYLCQATSGGDAAAYHKTYLGIVQALQASVPEAKVMLCSSCSLYGGRDGAAVDESTPLAATGKKAEILSLSEQVVLSMGGRVLRLSALYGEGRSVLLPRYCAGIIPVCGTSDRLLNYVHVDDVVDALLLAEHLPAGIYNVSSDCLSKADLLSLLGDVCPLPPPTREPAASRRGASHQRVDAGKLKRFGWQARHELRAFLMREYLQGEG